MRPVLAEVILLGMLAAVNPCAFPLLPAYLIRFSVPRADEGGLGDRAGRSLAAGGAMTLGFTAVFAVIGGPAAAALHLLLAAAPPLLAVVGFVLVVGGLMALAGRPAGLRLPHLTFRSGTGFAAAFLYGVAYAGASLGCSLPLFAAAVARGAAASGPAGAEVAVVGYALGMGLLVAGVGQVIAWSGAAAGRRLANAGRWASALGAALTLVIGLGLVFVGLRELGLPEPAVIATAQTGVADALALSPALLAGLLGVPVVVGLVVVALRAGAQRRSGR